MPIVDTVSGQEIIDSRGRPTVLATCVLRGGVRASASVPAGASTGSAEAKELRDGDPRRYSGLGCQRAVAKIDDEISSAVSGKRFDNQQQFDHTVIELDGTPDKSHLGANAILAVSLAFAKATALSSGRPLYQVFSELLERRPQSLPRLTINLFSGGKHAGAQVAIQDVLIVPLRATTIDETLAAAHDVYEAAADLIFRRYGMRRLRADEGGLAPPVRSSQEMIELALESIHAAGYKRDTDIALAVDIAATQFYRASRYHLDGEVLDGLEMVERLSEWVEKYSLRSVEDGLAEEDWSHWRMLRSRIAGKALVVGDDLLCTNLSRIAQAIERESCDALLLKVNQTGTLTEAAEACRLARSARWSVIVSVRSGETEDTWAADLAVGWCADYFKNGSITQSERTAKYNRLLAIERDTGWPVQNAFTNAARVVPKKFG
jgi:enolase